MERACNRATALVRQILTFGSRHDRDRQVVQLEDVVAEGLKLLRATLPAEIGIRADYAPGLPAVLADPNHVGAVAAAARGEPKRGRGERILYLDDEESLVVLAKRLLERMGYQDTGFNDSAQALAAFKTAPGRWGTCWRSSWRCVADLSGRRPYKYRRASRTYKRAPFIAR